MNLREQVPKGGAPVFAHNAAFGVRFIWTHDIANFIDSDNPVCCSLEPACKELASEPTHSIDALASSLSLVAKDEFTQAGQYSLI